MMNEKLVRKEKQVQINLFPVLKCGSTWFYAKNPVKGNHTVNVVLPKQEQHEDKVQKMALF